MFLRPPRPYRVCRALCGLLLLCFLAEDAAAQQGDLRRPAAPHYDVVALRVEFQPDTTRFTTGDGTFGGVLYKDLTAKVDPLPHDAAYFEAHLSFLQDYVAHVSDGQTTLTTHLVPEVVRVSKQMAAYSPTGPDPDRDDERAKLAALIEEAWTLASQQSTFDLSGFDPERTAFILFHAGVGRDIELIGQTFDKTPEDLPSIFFDSDALNALIGRPSVAFNGFPVDHSLIIPRTETRPAFDFISDQRLLIELSINGLLAASFFNYLGVPDLVDVERGESAIGPFGLMDPLGFLAYNGLFAPEPMAWTRYYLGWVDPVELTGDGPQKVQLRAVGLPGVSDVARAAASEGEYFLVENRHRDPEGDGLVLKVWKDGQVTEQRFENGAPDFNSFDVSGFEGGVVIAADDYDWALPGGLDGDGNALLGGILVWHIDEGRLAARLAENRVNVGPIRGIDLEEADSAQDIGFPPLSPFAPEVDRGTPFDFFYRGNPTVVSNQIGADVRLYKNRFGPDTVPNSDTNEGGASFIVLDDFSEPGILMDFVFRRESAAGITPLTRFDGVRLEGTAGDGAFLMSSPGGAVVYRGRDAVVIDTTDATTTTLEGEVQPVMTASGTLYLVERGEGRLSLYSYDDGVRVLRGVYENQAVRRLLGPVVAVGERLYVPVLRLFGEREVLMIDLDSGGIPTVVPFEGDVLSLASTGDGPMLVGRTWAAAGAASSFGWSYDIPDGQAVGQAAFGRDAAGVVGAVPVLGAAELLWLLPDGRVRHLDVAARMSRYEPGTAAMNANPVLADLDGDGLLDVVTTYGSHLVAFTQGGAVVSGFPIRMGAPTTAQLLLATLTDSGAPSVLVAGLDGDLYAYDLGRRGDPVDGFPLSVGRSIRATPLLADGNLYAVSADGSLKAWRLEGLQDVTWGQRYGGPMHQSFARLPGGVPTPSPGEFHLVPSETYNWPNPVRDGETHLRFLVTHDARLDVKIIDAAGMLIEEVRIDEVRGGVPAEHTWRTDVQSGLYYARITATGLDGSTDTRVVKMAVIR